MSNLTIKRVVFALIQPRLVCGTNIFNLLLPEKGTCAILSTVDCPALQYFSTLSHKRHNFRKKSTERKICVLIFVALLFLCETFLILRRNARGMIITVHRSCVRYRYYWQIVMKNDFYRQIFDKHPNIKFHENLSSGDRLVPCGRTDGHY